MHNSRLAQRILEFVTTRERAAAIAGDLMEDAAARGTRPFWPAVRIAASHILREFRDTPCQPMNLAGRGVRDWWNFVLLAILVTPWVPAFRSAYRPFFGFHGPLLPCLIALPFLIGWRAGSRAGERALTAGLCLAVLFVAFGAGDILAGVLVGPNRDKYPAPMAGLFCLAGAICQRAYTLRRNGSPARPAGTGVPNA